MNVSEFLTELTRQGVQLWAKHDKLRIHAPKGVLTPEQRTVLTAHKTEILAFLNEKTRAVGDQPGSERQEFSLETIGRLIGGSCDQSIGEFSPPLLDPGLMAKQLKVTFRPLPNGYKKATILGFRGKLERQLRNYGVQIVPWHQATKELCYNVKIPFTKWKKRMTIRVVKEGIHAVIDVDRPASLRNKVKSLAGETLYRIYSHIILRNRKVAVSTITTLIGWVEDHILPCIEDPTNTQVVTLTEIDREFINPQLPYQRKIAIGVKTIIRTLSQIVIGVSDTCVSVLNMNLSDSIFPTEEMDNFVYRSLIPKMYVPIVPLPMNRFTVGEYDPAQSDYAVKLVRLAKALAATDLFPSGFKLKKVIKRKSHRDIIDVIVNGRTGVSYGFVAYAEAPQYVGKLEIRKSEWERLLPVEGFRSDDVRQNKRGRWYLKTRIGPEQACKFKQIPDIWLVSSRSGAHKTDLDLEKDILRIGLKNRLLLQLPRGIDPAAEDIKPSYDLYVMVAIALSAALYIPDLIRNGAPIVHFHGYPSIEWFTSNEYCTGVHNPSVPCGTYESGVFNYLGLHRLAEKIGSTIALACLIEPDHGTNIVAHDLEYLIERLNAGSKQRQIELGGKYFASLESITV